jgi:hypothetical protein
MPSETHRRLLTKTQDDEPPRTEEGMLIGWPEAPETLREAMGAEQYHDHSMGCRNLGVDPDGPLKPMQPYKTDEQQLDEVETEGERHVRDWCLINALRFT